MATKNGRRQRDLLPPIAVGVLLVLAVLAVHQARAHETAWDTWRWVQECDYRYDDRLLADRRTGLRCEATYVHTHPDTEPEPEPEPAPGNGGGEVGDNVAQVTEWGCFNGARCDGEPVEGTLTIRHGGGNQNSPGSGSNQPLEPGERYRIRYSVTSCTAEPCRHRFTTGPGQRSEMLVGAPLAVDETVTADKPRLNFAFPTSDKDAQIAIGELRIEPAD